MCNGDKPIILAVDDDEGILQEISQIILDEKWMPKTFSSSRQALEFFKDKEVACVVVDLIMPDMDGMELLKQMKAARPQVPILMLTGEGYNVDNAIEATRLGATNFLTKPVASVQLTQSIHNALQLSQLQASNEDLRRISYTSHGIYGRSPAMQELIGLVEHLVAVDYPILITGEVGSGKSMLAEAIHALSPRRDRPFYTIDCPQLSPELFPSEVFGHRKGAFTGAVADKKGKVEMADGGTLFLDEIQDLNHENQGRLRRFIEHQVFTRVGDLEERRADTRIILATNRDLEELVRAGRFLEDLYSRIKALTLQLPPLNERIEDIPEIAARILKKEAEQCGKPFIGLTEHASHYLQSIRYQRNIRDLQGLLRLTVALAEYSMDKQYIDEQDLHRARSIQESGPAKAPAGSTGYNNRLDEFKRKMITEALKMHGYNMTRAAEYLELTLTNLSQKVRRYGIDVAAMKREVLEG